MEFMQRGGRPNQPVAQPTSSVPAAAAAQKNVRKSYEGSNLTRYITLGLVAAIAILLVATSAWLAMTKGSTEASIIDRGRYQAVFLNGGQVYFGKIVDVTGKTMRMSDIYYLRVNQQVQPGQQASSNDVSLVKLGCELHGPQDQMVINREQITFWENLKDDGQVAKAVKQYKEQNPNGQKCETSQSTQTSNGQDTNTNSTQPAPTPAPTPPASNRR